MSRMNRNAAKTIPTPIARTMSNSTVSEKQVMKTSRSALEARRTSTAATGASLMFQATVSRIAAMAGMGT